MTDPRLPGILSLLEVMDKLRSEKGCPWDLAQTHATLRPFLLEETFEFLESLDGGDVPEMKGELGDLLFQVIFHARIKQEEGQFHFGDVAQAMTDKLLRRHPHVFGDPKDQTSKEAWKNWEQLKKEERGPDASVLDGVPKALPALARSQRLQDKAARVGFDWSTVDGPLDKIIEEVEELRTEIKGGKKKNIAEEFGDLLFSVVAVARHLEINSEDVLREANAKFERRFRHMEKTSDEDLKELSPEQLEALWEKAKAGEKRA